jgi:G patch domain-containing protein 1
MNTSFPIPEVPQGWIPNPKGVWEKEKASSKDKENETIPPPSQPQAHAKWKAGISADQV